MFRGIVPPDCLHPSGLWPPGGAASLNLWDHVRPWSGMPEKGAFGMAGKSETVVQLQPDAGGLARKWGLRGRQDPLVDRLLQAHDLLQTEPLVAAREAEEIFALLDEGHDLAPWLAFVIAVSGRIRTLSDFHSLDALIDFFDRERARLAAPPEVLREVDAQFFGALVFRCPDHPRLSAWEKRCMQIFEGDDDSGSSLRARLTAASYLLLHRIWCGDLVGAEALRCRMPAVHQQTTDVYDRLLCYSFSSVVLRLYHYHEACLEQISEGLALAQESGVHFWDSNFYMQGAMLALTRGNRDEAREWLDKMGEAALPEYYLDRSGYHYCRAWMHTLMDDIPLAVNHAREAVELAARSGAVFPQAVTHTGIGQLYVEQRRYGLALYHLLQARRAGRRMRSAMPVRFVRGLMVADICFRLGARGRGRTALREAFRIGREQQYLDFPWWRGQIISRVCAHALEEGIDPDYARTLIRVRRLTPPAGRPVPEGWYRPLEIEVLGPLCVMVDGKEVSLTPQLIKVVQALVCLADGRGWAPRDLIADTLWPGSEGDKAQQTLDTALHRLRRQLGTEGLVLSRPGRVALDPDQCRIDYRELQALLEKEPLAPADINALMQAAKLLDRLTDPVLFELLPVDTLRQQVVTRALQLLDHPDFRKTRRGEWLENLAAHVPSSERIWQALIAHYLDHGMEIDAAHAAERCRTALQRHLQAAPSPALQQLMAQIPANKN